MTALLCIILLLSCIISIYTLLQSKLSTAGKALLIINRLFIISIIYLAFLQPSITITSLASSKNSIPVLIDLSASMKLFNADSIVSLFSKYESLPSPKKRNGEPEFRFFGFGDSCRPISDLHALEFKDRSSTFPRHFTQKQIFDSRKILIISDGNWSNVILGKNILHDKQCFFLPLRQISNPSYIHITSQNILKSTLNDSLSAASIMIQGYNRGREPLVLSCRRGQKILAEKKIQADSTFFTETISLPVRAEKAGISLLEVHAKLGDTISSSCYVLHYVKPSDFSAYLYSSRPSLDKRFLTLAINRKEYWKIVKDISQSGKETDVLVFLDWDAHAQQILDTHKKQSAVFIGCLPGEKPDIIDASLYTSIISPDFRHVFGAARRSDLPPLPECLTYKTPPFNIQRVIISLNPAKAIHESDDRGVPLLFEARLKERIVLVFAAKGIWRWDFWPKSLDNTDELLFFTDFIVDRMEELVQYNTNRSFYVYPQISPVYETDSISFKLALPSYLYNLTTVKADFSITGRGGDTVYDSSFSIMSFQALSITLKTPPLKQGIYQYFCRILSERKELRCSDSIKISADNSELRILGQNTSMLKEIAEPLALLDPLELVNALKDDKTLSHQMNETSTQTIKINRSWLLLCLIIGLLALEWILRRMWRLD